MAGKPGTSVDDQTNGIESLPKNAHRKWIVVTMALIVVSLIGVLLLVVDHGSDQAAVDTFPLSSICEDIDCEPATSVPPPDERVIACEQRAQDSLLNVKFAPLAQMTVGKSSKVVVTAGQGAGPISSATIPDATSTSVEAFPDFTCEVAAQLHGALFDIDRTEKIAQSFVDQDLVTWTWNVVPTSTDASDLDVDLYPVIRTTSGDQIPGAVASATIHISVQSAPGKSWWSRARLWVGGVAAAAVAAVVLAWAVHLLGPSKEGAGRVGRMTRQARWWWNRRTKHSSADLRGGGDSRSEDFAQVFVSYSRKDADFVERLNRGLSAYGYHAWVDTSDIHRSGDDRWRTSIVAAIRHSKAMILVLSPDSTSSMNVLRELSVAADTHIRLIPIVCQQCEIPEGFVYELAGIQRIDFTTLDFNDGVQQLVERLGLSSDSEVPPPELNN